MMISNDMLDGLLADDVSKQQAKEDAKKRKDEKLLLAYKAVAETQPGKIVLTDILNRCHVLADPFTGNSRTYYLLGEQNIGRYILNMLKFFWVNNLDEGLSIVAELARLLPDNEPEGEE